MFIFLILGLKDKMEILEIGRGVFNGKENFKKEEILMKIGSIYELIFVIIISIIKSKVIILGLELVESVANKKKGDEKKRESLIGKGNEKVLKVISVKSKDI